MDAWYRCATRLHSGDIVEILTQPGHKPSRDWLGLVKSSRSRNKIKHWLNVHQRERAIEIGRKLIEKEARKYRIALKEIKDEELQRVASGYGLGKADDLMSGIGYGKYSARQVLARLLPAGATHSIAGDIESEGLTSQPGAIASVVRRVFGDHNAITVRGQGDMLVYRARCCNPIRGESIVGYITRGKGRRGSFRQVVRTLRTFCTSPNERLTSNGPAMTIRRPPTGEADRVLRRPLRHVEEHHRSDWRCKKQYPQHHRPHREQPGERRGRARHFRPKASGAIIAGLRKIAGVHEVQRLQKI